MSACGRLCCKTRKYRLNKILAKVSSPSALVRDTVVKQMGGPLSESVEVDAVPLVRNHRMLQRPLASWVSRCERVLQHNRPQAADPACPLDVRSLGVKRSRYAQPEFFRV